MNDTATGQLYLIDSEIEDFLLERQIRRISKGTLGVYKRNLGKWRNFCVSHEVYATIDTTPRLLRGFLAELEAQGHNEGGTSHIFRPVKTFLLWYEDEYEPANWRSPTRKVKVRRPKPPLLEPISLEQFRMLIATCQVGTFNGDRDLAILYTLLDTGLRRQELADLKIGDIDLSTGQILVRCGKGGKSRIVFVGETTRRAIETYLPLRDCPLIRFQRQRYATQAQDELWIGEDGGVLRMMGIALYRAT